GKINSKASYGAFTVDPLPRAAASTKPDAEPTPIPSEQAAHPSTRAKPPLRRAVLSPFAAPRPAARSRTRWWWLAASIALAALGIGVLTGVFHEPGESRANPALSLRAYDHAGQVRIEWDRSAAAVLSARKASLFITDGNQALETEVSPQLLHHGSMV